MLFDVVQCLDDTGQVLCSRFPANGDADLVLGSALIVRESQAAVFCRDGRTLDVFGPGRYSLSTQNLPILGSIYNWALYKGNTPFKAEVYYVALQTQLGVKWGTTAPIAFEDQRLGVIDLRAFGVMSYRVARPDLLLHRFVGTRATFNAKGIEDYLRDVVVTRLSNLLVETVQSVIGVAQRYNELSLASRARLAEDFDRLGLVLEDFLVQGITPPPEITAKLNKLAGRKIDVEGDIYEKRAELHMVGQEAQNLGALAAYRSANAIGDAAQNPGLAGAAMGMGVGIGAGAMIPGMMQHAIASVSGPNAPRPCPKCGKPTVGKFCGECGAPLVPVAAACPKCQQAVTPGAKFCNHCGAAMGG
jgi:membrane protease subunit (stomatin/prohibitin family)